MKYLYSGYWTAKMLLFTFGFSSITLLSYLQQTHAEKNYTDSQKINGLSFIAPPKQITGADVISVKKVNAQWVSLMPFAFMKNVDLPVISYNSDKHWRGCQFLSMNLNASLITPQTFPELSSSDLQW